MKIGPYRIVSLETGRFGLDGGAMFGVVPKTLWSRTNPSDERNRIPLAMRALLILDEERKILVDVGCGHKFPDKLKEIYRLDHSRYTCWARWRPRHRAGRHHRRHPDSLPF